MVIKRENPNIDTRPATTDRFEHRNWIAVPHPLSNGLDAFIRMVAAQSPEWSLRSHPNGRFAVTRMVASLAPDWRRDIDRGFVRPHV
jgi:hypothetical protein